MFNNSIYHLFCLYSAFGLPFPKKLLTRLYEYDKMSMEREIAPAA